MAVKGKHNGISWIEWPEDIRFRKPESVEAHHIELQQEVEFQYFMQFKAFQQWYNLKNYANSNGVKFIGDMPIYVAYDSSDVWTKPQYFQLDENRKPILVAGVPPDNFSADGQLWGNPLYNWPVLENEYFSWWIDRVRSNTSMFDMVRIDHFIGFVNFFGIPFGDTTARNGQWYKGPAHKLFDAIKWQLGDRAIIAEDLGVLTDEVRNLLSYTGFPGMKLLQFGFDASGESDYLPHHYKKNSIAYTGTHDNMTTKEWFDTLNKNDEKFALAYLNYQSGSKVEHLIRATLATVSDTAIIPVQDYLELGPEGRFNIPSTLGGNWTWRLTSKQITKEVKDKVKVFTKLYGRASK
ncbi:4-alpha-glucanotransferase [Acholeplasma hippikon]|uniref:4-alpha-glucanotransferase n=2 Tax=Acholeplasma hippikon TaxID=264636 RepID=A0A449BIW1_9MOLU|nr:4-alpha-glucanotransferase [Acholeplasma hippikon]